MKQKVITIIGGHEMKVKFFRYDSLENEINKFLSNNPNIKIKFIKQSSASDGYGDESIDMKTVISVWYEANYD